MPRGEDFLLPIEREVIAKFSDDDRCNQPWRCDAALLQRIQRGDDRRCKRLLFEHVFAADDVQFNKLCWIVIEQLGDFLADAPPVAGAQFHLLPLRRLCS